MFRVLRDYSVLLVCNRLTQGLHEDMLKPIGFAGIEATNDDQKVIGLIRKKRPNLVVTTGSLSVFSGPQLLSAARGDKAAKDTPFLVLGDKDDLKPGGMADQVNNIDRAHFIALPMKPEEFKKKLLEFLGPLIDPKQEEAYGLMDQAAEKNQAGELIEAAELYNQALNLYDRHLSTWINLAAIQSDLEKFDEAEQSYFQALKLDNYSLLAYFGLAELYERRQDFEQTIGLLRQALGIAKMLKVSAKSVSKINFFIGEFELRLKRLTGAEQSFDRAIENNQEDAGLRADIGDAYSGKGYYSESEAHYETALQIDPNLAHVFNRLGIAYRRQGKFDKALQLYKNARMHHPEDENLLFNIARANIEAERPKEAVSVLKEALLMAPDFREAGFLVTRLRKTAIPEIDWPGFNEGQSQSNNQGEDPS